MKKLLLLMVAISFVFAGIAQKSLKTKEQRQVVKSAVHNPVTIHDLGNLEMGVNPTTVNVPDLDAFDVIGYTWYDFQTNTTVDNRMCTFPDGTMAAVWTFGPEGEDPGFTGRGAGYVYHDGTDWSDIPTQRIETDRCGWPSVAPLGENGEIVVSHYAGAAVDGLAINRRETKGSGEWTEYLFEGPDGLAASFPRMVTAGENHEIVHMTHAFLDLEYGGMTNPCLYNRSMDGGETWDQTHVILDGMGPDDYSEIGSDNVVWAEPRGGTVAFCFADMWVTDLVIMKSENDGEDWEKIVVWEHPFPFFDFDVTVFDSCWVPDGTTSCAIDADGKVHLVASLTRTAHTEVGTNYNYWPYAEGIVYWNEDMDPFEAEDQTQALDAWDFSGALVEDYNYIGWGQDMNGDGEWTLFNDALFTYRFCIGASTMPALACGENGEVALAYAGISEVDIYNESFNYRRIWTRKSYDNGATWTEHYNINNDVIYSFDECIYPVMNKTIDGAFHVLYQADYDVGTGLDGDHDYVQNRMTYYTDEIVGMPDRPAAEQLVVVSQNYPNPATTTTKINVELPETNINLSLEVSNTVGQVVYTKDLGLVRNSQNSFIVDVSEFTPGIYFYTVKVGNESVTHKMIVE